MMSSRPWLAVILLVACGPVPAPPERPEVQRELDLPSPTMAADAATPDLVAYLSRARSTLYVVDQDKLAAALHQGAWKLEWERGAPDAIRLFPDGKQLKLAVQTVALDVLRGLPVGADDERLRRVASDKESYPAVFGVCKGGVRLVGRPFRRLKSGGEFFALEYQMMIFRYYVYDANDCKGGFRKYEDFRWLWVLEADDWPLP